MNDTNTKETTKLLLKSKCCNAPINVIDEYHVTSTEYMVYFVDSNEQIQIYPSVDDGSADIKGTEYMCSECKNKVSEGFEEEELKEYANWCRSNS